MLASTASEEKPECFPHMFQLLIITPTGASHWNMKNVTLFIVSRTKVNQNVLLHNRLSYISNLFMTENCKNQIVIKVTFECSKDQVLGD